MHNSSKPPAPPLLVLSNGHGEDLIAARVLTALRRQGYDALMEGMALVGLGDGLASVPGLRPIGPRQQLPSGGFSN
ncbi:MAG TPA: sugar synthetase, partial [Synechococcus sp. UBA8638]|nr:sugar synthetase [Synechococcus sp. UBA8638]